MPNCTTTRRSDAVAPKHRHNCGDPSCPKLGRDTCALCDDAGPPAGSKRRSCPERGRMRPRAVRPGAMDGATACACGGRYAVADGRVAHSTPSCDEFARLSGGAFVERQRARRGGN